MIQQSILLKLSSQGPAESTTSQLRQEYQAFHQLFQAQPAREQQFFSNQAAGLADAIMQGMTQVHFSLPGQVVCQPELDGSASVEMLPPADREQRAGNFLNRFVHTELSAVLYQRLSELEQSSNQAVSASAGLLRYAIAVHIIYHLLPVGQSVVYAPGEEDDIPDQPVQRQVDTRTGHALLANMRIDEQGLDKNQEIKIQYPSAAQGFFMPQWVAFDEQNHLLVNDLQEASDNVSKMQRYLFGLNSAVRLAPYMVVDDEYQAKRYGMLGQLVNQGRALANYKVHGICMTIKQRAAVHKLDRGFSLSLPYFNDETLTMESYNFDVIPVGRVMYVPAFVVLAVRAEGAKVMQDTHLNQTTRRSLLQELMIIEKAFLR